MSYSTSPLNRYVKLLFILAFCSVFSFSYSQEGNIIFKKEGSGFCIANSNSVAKLVYDSSAATVIGISAQLFADDLEKVSGKKAEILRTLPDMGRIVLIGTLESEGYIKNLIDDEKIDCSDLEGQWETAKYFHLSDPFPGIDEALVIVGSDRRGAAYGLMELSRQMGVSPWIWWANVSPQKNEEVYFTMNHDQFGPPDVKYRGIFINDEDWSLLPWVKKTFDPELGNIGPKTYEKVYELMLRLRSNYLWPAMHRCSDAFNEHPENYILADKYAIVTGTSHAEPMLRNNYDEWPHGHASWNYFTHKELVHDFWNSCLEERGQYENLYTVGMRGIHDDQMAGSGDFTTLARKMEEIFEAQRNMIENHTSKKASEVPQLLCPYKEVLYVYEHGLQVPEDVTILWPEDNEGYIRRYPTEEEQLRSGGHGVYYHLQYWSDYLWLSSIAPPLIAYEMQKAAAYNMDRIWVVNVGDIKVCEKETEFFMDMAWDLNAWTPTTAQSWIYQWAARTFGTEYSESIGNMLNEYYQLCYRGKPEHIGHINFPMKELHERLDAFTRLAEQVDQLKGEMPQSLQTAFIHLVYYQIAATKYHHDKVLKARLSYMEAARGNMDKALQLADEAQEAYEKVLDLTEEYNDASNGKWKHFMNYNVRNLDVLREPKAFSDDDLQHHHMPCYTFFPEDATLHGAMIIKDGALTVIDSTPGALEASYATFEFPVGRGDWHLKALVQSPNPKEEPFSISLDRHHDFVPENKLWGSGWEWKNYGLVQMDPASYKMIVRPNELGAKIKQVSYTLEETPFYPVMQAPAQEFTLADTYKTKAGKHNTDLEVAAGLSMDGDAIYLVPHTAPSFSNAEGAPYMEFKVALKEGENWLRPAFLPSHAIKADGKMRCAISVDGGKAQTFNMNKKHSGHSMQGCNISLTLKDEPALRGYVFDDVVVHSEKDRDATVRISFLDPGLAFFRMEVYHGQ